MKIHAQHENGGFKATIHQLPAPAKYINTSRWQHDNIFVKQGKAYRVQQELYRTRCGMYIDRGRLTHFEPRVTCFRCQKDEIRIERVAEIMES
jgi:hypothetical protein